MYVVEQPLRLGIASRLSSADVRSRIYGCRDLLMNPALCVARICLLAADAIVVVLTWSKTFGQWRRSRRLNMHVSVTTCLLRDGKLGFSNLDCRELDELCVCVCRHLVLPVSRDTLQLIQVLAFTEVLYPRISAALWQPPLLWI